MADLGEERVSHGPFGDPPVRTRFNPDKVAIESADWQVLEELRQPRDSFAGHVQDTPWNRLQLAYFVGTAMWTYLTQPFSFTMPGFVISEGDPWVEDGKTYRRMLVSWPSYLATHNPDQVVYLDEAGLIFRHDYTVEITGGTDGPLHDRVHRSLGSPRSNAAQDLSAKRHGGSIRSEPADRVDRLQRRAVHAGGVALRSVPLQMSRHEGSRAWSPAGTAPRDLPIHNRAPFPPWTADSSRFCGDTAWKPIPPTVRCSSAPANGPTRSSLSSGDR